MWRGGSKGKRQIYGDFFFQRASAAFFEIWLRFFAESFLSLAFPPFNPPSLPRAAAARLMAIKAGEGGGGLVAASTICEAMMLMSVGFLLERLGIPTVCHKRCDYLNALRISN